jgi:hypothetical protein
MYRLQVIGTVTREVKRRKKITTETFTAAWDAFNPDEKMAAIMGRPGFGSFYWPTPYKAFRKARVILSTEPNVTSVQIRGMQGQMIGRVFKHQVFTLERPLLAIARFRKAA